MRKILEIIFYICALLCIVYFGVIIAYSGFSTSLCYVWIIFALFFVALSISLRHGARNKEEMPAFLPTFIYTSFGLVLTCFTVIMLLVVGAAGAADAKDPDYCIVMGARVYSNGISRTLMYRLDEAYEVYEDSPDTVFILAGGQARGDAIPEAFAMYNYLMMKGVPGVCMFVEARSTNTVGIVRNAAAAIRADADNRKIPKGPGEAVWSEDYEPLVGIITSDYHMFRSLTIARDSGISNAVAIPAKSDTILFVHNCVRESISIIKDFFMGNVTINESRMPEIPFNRIPGN